MMVFFSCGKMSDVQLPEDNQAQYLFLGHTYLTENRVDTRLEKIDYQNYDGIWLGGDLCAETTRERATLDYLDNLFDLSNESTHWAVGNHDVRNGNLQWIRAATGRDLFYATTQNGITIAVMDTNLGHVQGRGSTCEERDLQATFFSNLVDTLHTSSHLVILMHWVIWGDTKPDMRCEASSNNCLSTFQFICNDGRSRFPSFLYDKLVDLEKRGIEVIVVSGDGGIFSKKYQYQTDEGIDFLISGLFSTLDRNNPPQNVAVNLNPDSILVFNHLIEEEKLTWEFINLDDFVN